jgi:hypothetical protein
MTIQFYISLTLIIGFLLGWFSRQLIFETINGKYNIKIKIYR